MNPEQFLDPDNTCVIPWGIRLILALAVFIIGPGSTALTTGPCART